MKKLAILFLLLTAKSFSQDFDYKDYNTFLKKFVSENGNVSYNGIKNNKAELDTVIAQFEKNMPTAESTKNVKISYYINLYNAYTLKIIVDNYPTKSIKNIDNVWDKKFIPQGKILYSLGDIEHKILRRLDEPRIHFAINCASISCPKLTNYAFEPEKLDTQLETVTKAFINDETKNNISGKKIEISEIFNWFSGDFKIKSTTLIDFLNKYVTTKIDKKAKISYKEYNWNLNE